MAFKPRNSDVHVESRARDQARWLVRDHGADAEKVIAEKLCRPSLNAANRYRYQLIRRELARLRRRERMPLVDRLAAMFGSRDPSATD
ncbi:MAG: hypothetical protein JWO65_1227 [Sphingomonas bacterium]|jgi:hypothetical protein|nr:hypothetical protein [Sphingomonas bacterium]